MIWVWSDFECEFLLPIGFKEFCEFAMMSFGDLSKEGLSTMNIF